MTYYDEQLRQLQEQVLRKARLEAQLQELESQCRELSVRVRALEQQKLDEQADVDRLEGRSLAAFFYGVIGKRDEKLSREREEAYAAKVKYDAASRERSAVEEDLAQVEAELDRLQGCEQRYRETLAAKAEAVKDSGTPEGAELLRIEERIAYLDSQKKELLEAIAAGQGALATTDGILSHLDSAEGWGTWDLLGGGMLTDLAKHSHLDEAQAQVERLQVELCRFKTELADVTIQGDLQVSIDGFLRFADFFFDGLFADWTVLDQINRSQSQVRTTRAQIEQVLDRLDALLQAAEAEQERMRNRRDERIVNASL